MGLARIDLSKLVLATTKNHRHRIYLGWGIYAEVTLRYTHKGFRGWPQREIMWFMIESQLG